MQRDDPTPHRSRSLGVKRARSEGCVSDLRLDQLLVGDLGEHESRVTQEHMKECARCSARWIDLDAARAAFSHGAPPLGPKRKEAPWLRQIAAARPIAAALAMAAALALWLRPPSQPDVELGEGTRLKGGARIGFFVQHGSAIAEGAAGDVVSPGDTLQFTYTSQSSSYFALISVDGARTASVYYPPGPRAARLEPGRRTPLDSSTLLDEVLGPETAYGLFCEEPIDLEPVRAAFQARPDDPSAPANCTMDRISFMKQSR